MSLEFRDAVRERSHIENGLVIVDTFVNHKVDPILMRSCGEWLARELGQADIVITSEASGIAPALAAATALGVPMVFAKKRPAPSEGSIARQVVSPTKGDRSWLEIKPHVLDGVYTAVVVDDFLPAAVTYVDYEIVGDAGECVLTDAAKPQLVTCTFDDPLAPGEAAPRITLLVTVDDIEPGEQFVNQARVRGTYAAREVDGDANFLDQDPELACEPTAGEVCDLSPRAGVTGGTPTTTTTESGAPTTTIVASNAATTTIAAELPPTGSNGTNTMIWIGVLLLSAGAAISLLVRRQTA